MADALITVTDAARTKILEVRTSESDPGPLALWLEVSGVQGGAFTYDMYFRRLDEAAADDAVQAHDDLSVVVPFESIEKVRGSTLDLAGGGMVLQNPNSPPPPAPSVPTPEGDLSGAVAQRILQVLEEEINPQIASHGGRADLVAVDESIAYLRLSGGCQGCGMAAATLSQGIEVAIIDAVPEIAEIVDVTDHAGGTNPYFEAAKK
jgi:Fe/S biogenesis protein NfuA